MRKLIFLILALPLFFSNCGQPSGNRNEKLVDHVAEMPDTFHLLSQYWELTDADNPASQDVSFTSDDGIEYNPGIVFMTDSSVLENPAGEMTYGKFSIDGNTIHTSFDDGRKAVYVIDQISNEQLLLSRTEKKHTTKLNYKATSTSWPESNTNPFARQNYKWTQKPKKPESDEEIRNRVKQFVQFYAYYFQGFVDGNAQQIDFNALPNCLNWYQGGISIQNKDGLDKKWMNCFYSAQQAFKGRQMLEDVIVKKYKWDEKETNWMKQLIPVLKQIHDNL
jgi:hypothetical protein